jgi:hypothetical protein
MARPVSSTRLGLFISRSAGVSLRGGNCGIVSRVIGFHPSPAMEAPNQVCFQPLRLRDSASTSEEVDDEEQDLGADEGDDQAGPIETGQDKRARRQERQDNAPDQRADSPDDYVANHAYAGTLRHLATSPRNHQR